MKRQASPGPVHCLHTPCLINCFTAKLKEMLTFQETERFAVEVLKIPYKAERVKNDPVSLLNEMTQAFHAAIPFHGISLLSVNVACHRLSKSKRTC